MSIRWAARPRGIMMSVLISALGAGGMNAARAQEVNESLAARLGLDRLQLVSLGATVGRVQPSQVVPAPVYAVSADYGEIARNWRIVFDVAFWRSRYSDRVVHAFADSLRAHVTDPAGDATIDPGQIQVYDVNVGGAVRWQSAGRVALRPYASFGVAAHAINAEGPLIQGTFVERALDNIATGIYLSGGVLFRPYGRVILDAQARVDAVSSFRSVQLRAGAQYFFGAPRGEEP